MYKTTIWLLLLSPSLLFAQNKYYSISGGMGITNAFIHSNSNDKLKGSNQTVAQYADSIKSFNAVRHNFSLNVWVHHSMGKKWDIQAGVGYIDMGYRRKQKDVKFGEKTYPGIGSGIIEEKSNSEKNIYYDYRFFYAQIPVWFNYRLYKSKDYKTTYQLTMGATPQFLIDNKITARLKNLTVDGEKKFSLDSTGYDARTINLQVNFGGRIEHKLDKTTTIIIQPMLAYHPFSTSNKPLLVNPFSIMVHLGLVVDVGGFMNKRASGN
jgi:hypothetical protein